MFKYDIKDYRDIRLTVQLYTNEIQKIILIIKEILLI